MPNPIVNPNDPTFVPPVVPEFPKLMTKPGSPDVTANNAAEEKKARADGYTVVFPNASQPLPDSPFHPSATVVPNPLAVPVAERHPVASELVAELKKKIGVWDGIEPTEFGKITDAQSKEAVEQHLREFGRTHGADHPAVIEARNAWAKQRADALRGYLAKLIELIAKWGAVAPVKNALDDVEVSKHVVADREAAEAVNLEMEALALKYGEHSEVVDEGRRLWNTAIRVGRKVPVVVAEPVV